MNRVAHEDATNIGQCIVALVQVFLHISYYALYNESGATTAADHNEQAVRAAAARHTGQRYHN